MGTNHWLITMSPTINGHRYSGRRVVALRRTACLPAAYVPMGRAPPSKWAGNESLKGERDQGRKVLVIACIRCFLANVVAKTHFRKHRFYHGDETRWKDEIQLVIQTCVRTAIHKPIPGRDFTGAKSEIDIIWWPESFTSITSLLE